MSADLSAAIAELGIASLGATLVMIAGAVDLSIGGVFVLAPTVGATLMERGVPFVPALLGGLLAGFLAGAVNAAGVLLRAPGVAISAVVGIAAWVLVRRLDALFPPLLPPDIPVRLFAGWIGPEGFARASLAWFAAVLLAALLAWPAMAGVWRAAGRGVRGAPVRRVRALAFLLSAVLAGFAGMLQMLRVGSPLPTMGDAPAWQALAAALIGGAFPRGGFGSVGGSAAGSVVVAVLATSLFDRSWLGTAVILAVAAVAAGVNLFRLFRRGGLAPS